MSKIKKIIRFLLLVLLIPVILIGYIYYDIHSFGQAIEPEQSDVIIVLGAAVWGDEPSPALKERCQWAYHLYSEGYAEKVIVSGGHGNGNISEAEAMKNYLVQLGMSEEAILLEPESRTTEENMKNSASIMRANEYSSAIIVSNQFHLKRAHYYAKREEGLYFSGHGENSKFLFEPYYTLREVGGAIIETTMEATGVDIKGMFFSKS
ncbi:YdcF family protein [Caldalkalibacillus mannanilyticus]|uniref:YdcF family protein n=1 Tax=Caldalkalibacillus mannanilyticus TaxID=1418 RepID=UPI0006847965|nr:YdcF family protein [Caldalkalibacillus mannanilyticus]